jgi:hypothetical protein
MGQAQRRKASNRLSGVRMPSTKPGIDNPTGRVVALIVLLITVAAALRGYLPTEDRVPLAQAGGGRAATVFVIAALAGTLALLAVAVAARLRDPRAVAPTAGYLPEMVGRGRVRPSWRVLLIGLGVIVVWLLIAMLLAHLVAPHWAAPQPPQPGSNPGAAPAAHGTAPPAKQPPKSEGGDMVGILLASAVPMLLIVVAGAVINTRRRRRMTPPVAFAGDNAESPEPAERSDSLVRAAELGLAEMADLSREPREAIIACYAAMERELANVPGAVPQAFDTPTEVLARAVEHHALHADNAVQLVNLFEEARFSPHVMNEGHREVAVRVLQLVLDELAAPANVLGSGA